MKWFESIPVNTSQNEIGRMLEMSTLSNTIITITHTPAQLWVHCVLIVIFSFLTWVGYPSWPFHWRSIHYLCALWALEQRPYDYTSTSTTSERDFQKTIRKVWFGGDTSLRSIPCGKKENMPICPLFWTNWREVWWVWLSGTYCLPSHIPPLHPNRTLFLQVIPIGAFSPREHFRPIYVSPSDTANIHKHVCSGKDVGIH